MAKKKLRSGMTLVEVVVAMSIFSVMTLGITMAFAACMKQNAKNVRRDYELNTQQTALEKGTEGGVQVYKDTFANRQTLRFTAVGGTLDGTAAEDVFGFASTPYENMVHYNAKNTAFNKEDINFQLKTFSSSNLGSNATVSNVSERQYVLRFNNLSTTDDIDIRIQMNPGTEAYTGDYSSDGYVIRTPLYSIALPAYNDSASFEVDEIDPTTGDVAQVAAIPSSMIVGLKMDEADGVAGGDPYVTINVVVNGGIGPTFQIKASQFIAKGGELEYNYYDKNNISVVS